MTEFNESVDTTYADFSLWARESGINTVPSKISFGNKFNELIEPKAKKVNKKTEKWRMMDVNELKKKIMAIVKCGDIFELKAGDNKPEDNIM